MKLKILILLSTLSLSSCLNNNSEERLVKLQKENDSLTSIVQSLKGKFIFDNAQVRVIPSIYNQEKVGTKFRGEIVVVGYNKNDYALLNGDFNMKSFKYENADTIRSSNEGYKFEIIQTLKDTISFTVNIDKKDGSRGYDSIATYPLNIFYKN